MQENPSTLKVIFWWRGYILVQINNGWGRKGQQDPGLSLFPSWKLDVWGLPYLFCSYVGFMLHPKKESRRQGCGFLSSRANCQNQSQNLSDWLYGGTEINKAWVNKRKTCLSITWLGKQCRTSLWALAKSVPIPAIMQNILPEECDLLSCW